MHILIAEHDRARAYMLQRYLTEAKYDFVLVSNGDEALREALRFPYSLILLGVKLPVWDGVSVTGELRRLHIQTPIILMAEQASTADKVTGLDAGADDYVTGPLIMEELMARIRAMLRRYAPALPPKLTFGDLTFHAGNSSISCEDREVRLNFKEAAIMKLLITSPQYILSKEEMINKVWGYASATSDNNVEAYISFLRKKLLAVESKVAIVAIKKQGYKLEDRSL